MDPSMAERQAFVDKTFTMDIVYLAKVTKLGILFFVCVTARTDFFT